AGATVAAGTTITGQGRPLDGIVPFDPYVATLVGGLWSGGPGGVMDGVTLDGDLVVAGNQAVTVRDGLTLNGTVTLGGGDGSYGVLKFLGSQALSGSGTVAFASASAANAVWLPTATTTLTVGPGITVQGQAGRLGHTAAFDYFFRDFDFNVHLYSAPASVAVVNQGSVRASGGGILVLDGTGGSNSGTLAAVNVGSLSAVSDGSIPWSHCGSAS